MDILAGRVYETMSTSDDHHEGGGALYRLDRSGRTEQLLDGLTIPKRRWLEP